MYPPPPPDSEPPLPPVVQMGRLGIEPPPDSELPEPLERSPPLMFTGRRGVVVVKVLPPVLRSPPAAGRAAGRAGEALRSPPEVVRAAGRGVVVRLGAVVETDARRLPRSAPTGFAAGFFGLAGALRSPPEALELLRADVAVRGLFPVTLGTSHLPVWTAVLGRGG